MKLLSSSFYQTLNLWEFSFRHRKISPLTIQNTNSKLSPRNLIQTVSQVETTIKLSGNNKLLIQNSSTKYFNLLFIILFFLLQFLESQTMKAKKKQTLKQALNLIEISVTRRSQSFHVIKALRQAVGVPLIFQNPNEIITV